MFFFEDLSLNQNPHPAQIGWAQTVWHYTKAILEILLSFVQLIDTFFS